MNRANWNGNTRTPKDSTNITNTRVRRALGKIKRELDRARQLQDIIAEGDNITYELPKEATNRPRLES